MRRSHELERGVVCERCKKIASKGNYVSMRHLISKRESTTGETKLLDRYNLCKSCYQDYMKITKEFLGGILI